MLNQKVRNKMNEQINREFYSAYLYLDFSNRLDAQGLKGYANWYRIQAQEERDHAMLMYDYMHLNGETVELEAIPRPETKSDKPEEILKAALRHEEFITASINDVYEEAHNVKDFRTMQFLDWFIKEQAEEENNAQDLITRTALFGSDPKGLYMLDAEMGQRVYNAPSLVI